MCFSEEVSWITLLVGTVLNIIGIIYLIHIPNRIVIIPILCVLAWQYGLLMQIPDALAWRNPSSDTPGKLAFILNVTQPLVWLMIVCIMFYIYKLPIIRLIPAIILFMIYILNVIRQIPKINFQLKYDNCNNLQYTWWRKISGELYIITMCAIILALPSIPLIVITLILFLGSLLMSIILVKKRCNTGSLWCWSIAICGFIIAIFWKYLESDHVYLLR
jgi:hypothetical protein